MKYSILYNGRTITPPDNVKKIYHGPHLIWERAAGAKIAIKKMFDATNLDRYRFTRNGLIIPDTVVGGKSYSYYDLTGKKSIVKIPKNDFMPVIEDGATNLFADGIAYKTGMSYPNAIYAESTDFSKIYLDIDFSDSEEQWSAYDSNYGSGYASYLEDTPLALNHYAGKGIFPISRPLAYMEDAAQPTLLCYGTADGLVTNAGYHVLEVLENSLLTADNITIVDGFATGRIVERELNGTIKRVLKQNYRFCRYLGSASDETGAHGEILLAGNKLVYTNHAESGDSVILEDIDTGELYDSKYISSPHNVIQAGGKFYATNDFIKNHIQCSSDGQTWTELELIDADGKKYKIVNPAEYGSICESDGHCYIIADSGAYDDDYEKIYSVLQIQYTEA